MLAESLPNPLARQQKTVTMRLWGVGLRSDD